ncbi:hypothetical protein [Botryobacter ruber]|uniref:hypothetical protein n=1 Tax=Botryobacter ruber TaxID=2171629 RepID=UPI000E0C5DDA|nr:hypothetical protein [Botryobacter ruber]
MKKILLLLLGFIALHPVAFGQVDETRNFIYLYSDSVIYARTIDYKTPLLGGAHLIVDARKVKGELVKFYQNEKGFFANTSNLNFTGGTTFSERIRKGKINLYELETVNYSPGHFSPGTGMYTGGGSSRNIKNYYNIGFGELKKADYKNLSVDLGENPESLAHLNKYKSNTNTQTILYVVGGAAILGGIISFANSGEPQNNEVHATPNMTVPLIGLGIGGASLWTSYLISLSKPKHLRSAIDAYNR